MIPAAISLRYARALVELAEKEGASGTRLRW